MMIQPATYNISVQNNQQFDLLATLSLGGSLFNLTGCSAKLQVRQQPQTPTKLVDFGVTPSTTLVLGGAAGTVEATAPLSVVATWGIGTYEYDLMLIDASGNPEPWLAGAFTVTQGVSR